MRVAPTPAACIAVSSLSWPNCPKPVAVPTSTDIGSVKISMFGSRSIATSAVRRRGAFEEPSTSANLVVCCIRRIAESTSNESARYGSTAASVYLSKPFLNIRPHPPGAPEFARDSAHSPPDALDGGGLPEPARARLRLQGPPDKGARHFRGGLPSLWRA